MWLFPWNPNLDFFSHYDIADLATNLNGGSIWTLHSAKKKGTMDEVSIFRFDIKEMNTSLVDQAKQSLKRIKTLRHPSILKYVDSSETEKSICIVTEAVTPLADYLRENFNEFSQRQIEFSIAYGILNVAKGLHFINNDCQLNHNNINIHSIFVTRSGVWKIGGLEYVCPIDMQPPSRNDELKEKYTPPERIDPSRARHPGQPYAVDSWGLGCLVWESFNKPLTLSSSVKMIGKIPKPLSIHYNKLVQSSPRHRCSPMAFIKECQEANVFFNTQSLEVIQFLDEIQLVKEPSEKSKFFKRLEDQLESLPIDICKNKVLPDLINAFEYGEAGSPILEPIFRIGKLLDKEEYQQKLVPCIIKLYACKDRAIRAKLLLQLDSYISLLSQTVINDQIFPQVVQGFLDSNFTIREQTVKSMLHLAPKLSSNNLNDELIKHFTRLQTRDEEGGIRANTTVCLSKIASHFNANTQQTVILPALLRALRDPFPPARHAAIAGLSTNESLFNPKDSVTKIMPALCQLCIDPDPNVRRLAFKAMRLFIDRAEAFSDKELSSLPAKTPSISGQQSSAPAQQTEPSHGSVMGSARDGIKSMSLRD